MAASTKAKLIRLSRPDVSASAPSLIAAAKAESAPARPYGAIGGSFTSCALPPTGRADTRSDAVSAGSSRLVQAISPLAHSTRHSPPQAVFAPGLTQLPRHETTAPPSKTTVAVAAASAANGLQGGFQVWHDIDRGSRPRIIRIRSKWWIAMSARSG